MQNLNASVKAHCFLCLAKTSRNDEEQVKGDESENNLHFQENDNEISGSKGFIHFQNICRFLKIDLKVDQWESLVQQPTSGDEDDVDEEPFEVSFCEPCSKIGKLLTDLFLELHRVKTDIRYCLCKVSEKIRTSLKSPGGHLFTHLVFIDKLRKEIAYKSLKKSDEMKDVKEDVETVPGKELITKDKKEEDYQDEDLECSLEIKQEVEDTSDENSDYQVEGAYSPSDSSAACSFSQDIDTGPQIAMFKEEEDDQSEDFEGSTEIKQEKKDNSDSEDEVDGVFSPYDSESSAASDSSPSIPRSSSSNVQLGPKTKLNPKTGLYQCTVCSLEFKQNSACWNHFKANHTEADLKPKTSSPHLNYFYNSSKRFQCTSCPKDFKNRGGAIIHFNAVHSQKKFQCENCGSVFPYKSSLRLHKKTCQEQKQREEMDKIGREADSRNRFECPTCNKKFPSRANLKLHEKRVHLQERPYPCDLCNKMFKTSTELLHHKEAVHEGVQYNCKGCKKQFKWRNNLKSHERSCLQLLQNKASIKQEVEQEGEHASRSVGKPKTLISSTDASATLGKDIVWDSNKEEYACSNCKKGFNDSKSAIQHFESIHLQKKWKCPFCEEFLSTRSNLRRHKKSCAKNEGRIIKEPKAKKERAKPGSISRLNLETGKHVCAVCSAEFTQKRNVWNHFQRKHSQNS